MTGHPMRQAPKDGSTILIDSPSETVRARWVEPYKSWEVKGEYGTRFVADVQMQTDQRGLRWRPLETAA